MLSRECLNVRIFKVVLALVALRCSQPHGIPKRNLAGRRSFYVWEGFPCEVTENMAWWHLEKQAKA
jgi:hypothetical protein